MENFRVLKSHKHLLDDILSTARLLTRASEKKEFILLNWNPMNHKLIPFALVEALFNDEQIGELTSLFEEVENMEDYYQDLLLYEEEIYQTNLSGIEFAVENNNFGYLANLANEFSRELSVVYNCYVDITNPITFVEDIFEDQLKYISVLMTGQQSKGCIQTKDALRLLCEKEPMIREVGEISRMIIIRQIERNGLLHPSVDKTIQNHQHLRFLTTPHNNWLYASFTIPQQEYILLGKIDASGCCSSFNQVPRTTTEDTFSIVTSWSSCCLTKRNLYNLHVLAQKADLLCRLKTPLFSLLFGFDETITESKRLECIKLVEEAGGKIALTSADCDCLITENSFGGHSISPDGLLRKCFHFMGGKHTAKLSRPIHKYSFETFPDMFHCDGADEVNQVGKNSLLRMTY